MILHAAHKTRSYRAKLSPGIGEHILAEIDAETLHLGEEAVHLRRRGVVVGVVIGAEEAALAEEPFLVAALALRVGPESDSESRSESRSNSAMRARGASATTRANSAKRLFLEGTSSRARSAAGAYSPGFLRVFATTARARPATNVSPPHRSLVGLPARAPPCSLRSERSCSLAAQRNAPASFATAVASPLDDHVRVIGTMYQLVSAVLGRRWGGPRPAGPAVGRNHSRRCSGGTS